MGFFHLIWNSKKKVVYYSVKNCRKCNVELVIGENITKARFHNYDYMCRPCFGKQSNILTKKRFDKLKSQSKPGVYGIYYGKELLYVGESTQCEYRFLSHKRTHKNTKNHIGLNISYIKDYTLKIFKIEEDLRLRKMMEMELIVKHKPKLNYPYREDEYIHNPQ